VWGDTPPLFASNKSRPKRPKNNTIDVPNVAYRLCDEGFDKSKKKCGVYGLSVYAVFQQVTQNHPNHWGYKNIKNRKYKKPLLARIAKRYSFVAAVRHQSA
jgi:hypothetical protein